MIARLSLAIAGAALTAVLAVPARAGGVPITTSVFTLTFPDGWFKDTTGLSEFPVVVLDTALDVSCLMTITNLPKPMTAGDLRIPSVTFSRGDSVFKVDEGTLTLGGREFLWAEYHGRDTTDGNKRVRAYHDLYDSTHLFSGFVDYIAPGGNPAVTQFESALATLDYPAPVPLLSPRPRPGASRSPAARDALGRSPSSRTRVPLFHPLPR